MFPHFITALRCANAHYRVERAGADGHLVPTNGFVACLKWPPTHFGGLCSSRRLRTTARPYGIRGLLGLTDDRIGLS
ncbi:unnamed protein product [Pieris brassicae]|uniref:Uncharacterized protein n=1 Tax=Pieris brassicae TaxID=7116 RepID=A0A9P0WSA9_PIEBR|nr:unnamed protein product [Pieris brassicae]